MLDLTTASTEALISFGVGCSAGYGFAMLTIKTYMQKSVDELKARVSTLEKTLEKRTDQLINSNKES